MSDHKQLSPSGADRWMNCPGSIRMEAGYPDKSSPAAEDGTKTHFLLEEWLKSGKPPIVGMEYDSPVGRFRHTEDRHERLTFTTGYIYDRVVEMDEEFGTDTTLISEQFIDSDLAFGRDDMGGTVDVQLINTNFLELVDLKDGMNPVDAKDNNQLQIYAINLIYKLMMENFIIEKVRLTIVQPKMRFNGESGISSWDVTTDYLMGKVKDFLEAAKATDDPDAPLIPGEKQCKYCKHGASCSVKNTFIFESSGINFEDVTNLPAEIVKVEENHISNDRLREIILAAPLMRSMLDHVEEEALRRFQIGQPVEGLKVIRGRGSKTWKVAPEEVADKLGKMGVPKALRWKQVMHTPAQAMRLVWTKKVKGKDTEAKLSKRQIDTLKSEYIQENPGSLKVVSESARGEAIALADEGMFKAVPELELPDFLK